MGKGGIYGAILDGDYTITKLTCGKTIFIYNPDFQPYVRNFWKWFDSSKF